jgi:hypothetical protein
VLGEAPSTQTIRDDIRPRVSARRCSLSTLTHSFR